MARFPRRRVILVEDGLRLTARVTESEHQPEVAPHTALRLLARWLTHRRMATSSDVAVTWGPPALSQKTLQRRLDSSPDKSVHVSDD